MSIAERNVQIIKEYSEGIRLVDIASKYGVSAPGVLVIVKKTDNDKVFVDRTFAKLAKRRSLKTQK